MTDNSVRYSLQKLQHLVDVCNPAQPQEKGPTVDLSKLSAYERAQYNMVRTMEGVRKNLAALEDAQEKGDTKSVTAKISVKIQRDMQQLNVLSKEAAREASKENKDEEIKQLMTHVDKTKTLYRKRFAVSSTDGDDAALARLGPQRENTPLLRSDSKMNEDHICRETLRNDQEFQLFFAQVTETDVKIDQALDRLSAGVQRITENAREIHTELRTQKAIISEVETKVDRADMKLSTLNNKLTETLKKVDQDKMCLYFVCCLLLLGLTGGILYATGVIKK